MSQKSNFTMAGAFMIGLGAFAFSAEPSFARGGHGGGAHGVIVTVNGVQHVIAVDNLPANFQPATNVQVIAHVPGVREARVSFQARRKAKQAAARAARNAARGR